MLRWRLTEYAIAAVQAALVWFLIAFVLAALDGGL